MLSIIKKHKPLIIFTSFIGIISSFFMVVAALMLANLLNVVLEGNIHNLIKQTLILVGVWGITILLEYLTKLLIGKSIQKMNSTLRSQIVDNLTLIDYEKFHSNDTGSYVSWLTNDLTQIENTAFTNFFTLITEISTVIFSLLGLFYINYQIFLLAIILCLFMLLIPKLLNKKVQDYSKITSEKQEEFVKSSKENLMGHEVFYSYNLLSNFSKNILKNSKILEESKYKFRKIRALNNSLIIFSTICAQIIMMFLAGYLSIKGITLIGSIIAATDLSGTFFRSFSMVLYCRTEVKSANPLFDKFKITPKTNKHFKDCPKFEKSIRIKNLNFSYDNKNIFSNLSLTFDKGKKYAIVGKSGTGKTTLIKLILGHLKDYNGEIYIDNENIKNYSDKSIRDNLSYISQNVYIFNESIKNNITLGEEFDENSLSLALKESSLNDFISSLDNNINSIINENGKNISGGQKQRIAIARSLIRNKPILIIDEGTSALDKQSSLEVESNLLKKNNLTVILITHHLNKDLMDKFDGIIDLDILK